MSAPAPLTPQLADFTALVVDDDDFVRAVVARVLRQLGSSEVLTASTTQAARSVLAASAVDVIVVDLMMPGADGIELMRHIANRRPQAALILMSSADPKVLRSAAQLAAERQLRLLGTLRKPVQAAALRSLLETLQAPAACTNAAAPRVIKEATLAAALEAGEIDVVVQPQVSLLDGQLAGAEALARWTSPQLGVVAPGEFLPVAERCGLMLPLTERVIGRALAACGEWRRQGLESRIAVNVSPSMLAQLFLPDLLVDLAIAAGVPVASVVVEITESGLVRNAADALEVMTRLRLRGIELSIDDFGTGHSSFERLKGMPFTELKLDRGFVGCAAHDPDARYIVESNARLARDLGLRSVAEGIEDEETLQLVKSLGCTLAQGFHVARPMPPAQLPAWLASRRA